jgi:hypothetical protein
MKLALSQPFKWPQGLDTHPTGG